jgi:hypothetical protein
MSVMRDARAGRQVGTTFDTDAHTRGCTSPPNVVCALWSTALPSDDTRLLSESFHSEARRRNVAITNHIRGDTRCHPRC